MEMSWPAAKGDVPVAALAVNEIVGEMFVSSMITAFSLVLFGADWKALFEIMLPNEHVSQSPTSHTDWGAASAAPNAPKAEVVNEETRESVGTLNSTTPAGFTP